MNFNWSKTIFPLLIADLNNDGIPSHHQYLGTCFFTIMEGFPLIVTAKHVIDNFDEELQKGSKCLIIATRYGESGEKSALRLLCGVAYHKKIDIGILVLEPNFYNKYTSEFKMLEISYQELPMGTDVFTFGYPDSLEVYDEFYKGKVPQISNFCFKGYISNIVDETEFGGTERTYYLSFAGMPGISGAPLMLQIGDKVLCAGLMFKNKRLDDRYEFGLACDAHPLLEMKKIIKDFLKRKG